MTEQTIITAAMLAIGDELLSGRTKDKNIGFLADLLLIAGIDLKEVRIVADEEDSIVDALNALRVKYDYVFTSGGIGPTHDDITADAISKAFGVPCEHDALAMTLLGDMYAKRGVEFTEARQRMARMPKGGAHRQSGLYRARLYHWQCACDGRCATGVSGDDQQCAADLAHRRRHDVTQRHKPVWRGRYRHGAGAGAEKPSRHQHRFLSAI